MIDLLDATEANVPPVLMDEMLPSLDRIAEKYFISGQIHDTDLTFFKHAKPTDIVCDIGANMGISAITLQAVGCRGQLHCFEINPVIWQQLTKASAIYGQDKFTAHSFGLGSTADRLWLYVPKTGPHYVLGEASLRLDYLQDPRSIARLSSYYPGAKITVGKLAAEVRRFDDLGLLPNWVKIDVEGAEMSVLDGMRQTLKSARPIFMIENSFPDAVDGFLAAYGYKPYMYHVSVDKLGSRSAKCANTFYLADESYAFFRSQGFSV